MKQPLDSRQLRAFVTLSETGSFTLAAKKLFLSQSAISHSIKALESDVSCLLFDRVGKKIALTLAGEQLLQRAHKILEDMESARQELSQLGKWGGGKLRLGASSTACHYFLPGVLSEFKKQYPNWSVTIESGDTPQMLEYLHEGQIDVAFGLEPMQQDAIEFENLFQDELAFVLAPQHAWSEGGGVVRQDIPRQNYVFYKKVSYTFHLVQKYFEEEGMVLNTIMEVGSMEAIKELVKLNVGISILAPWIIKKELENKSLVTLPLGRRKLKRTWGLIKLKSRRFRLAEESFLELCRQAVLDKPAFARP